MNAADTTWTTSDEELIRRYRESAAADLLDELAGRYLAKIRVLVRSMVLEDAAADDVTQDAFLRAFRGLPAFDGRSTFSTWLHRIAMNSVYSYLQRQARSPVVFGAALPETPSTSPQNGDQEELQQAIETALAALTPKMRAAIVLTTLQGKSPHEAADIENCTVATIYWRIHVARKQLKSHLAGFLQ